MCSTHEQDPYLSYQRELVAAGLLVPGGVRGVYGLGGDFERVIEHFEALVTREGAGQRAEVVRFPPVFSRSNYLRHDHIETMPDLLGSVHGFHGGEKEHRAMVERVHAGDDGWTDFLEATDLVMVPAACYPLYPTATGTLGPEGRTVDLRTFVFRHEPSDDPARMQCFRQREYVRLGSPEQAQSHRDAWLEQARRILASVGLEVEAVVANDPFFGRGGKLMKATQREQALKYELVIPICSREKPTAITSCNYHLDHFGQAYDIRLPDGSPAHSSCIGFGLERIALALFRVHGLDTGKWPASVRGRLALE